MAAEWLHDSVQFISDKCRDYEKDCAKKNEIIGNLQWKSGIYQVSKPKEQADQQEHYSKRNWYTESRK